MSHGRTHRHLDTLGSCRSQKYQQDAHLTLKWSNLDAKRGERLITITVTTLSSSPGWVYSRDTRQARHSHSPSRIEALGVCQAEVCLKQTTWLSRTTSTASAPCSNTPRFAPSASPNPLASSARGPGSVVRVTKALNEPSGTLLCPECSSIEMLMIILKWSKPQAGKTEKKADHIHNCHFQNFARVGQSLISVDPVRSRVLIRQKQIA